ncbi:MAG: sigma-70 family RNA polymerase sigma factor [Acetatifactor sp.]|nr:sigma-70 family RNA polymerase sigma factor [Acetatifactor sp.]
MDTEQLQQIITTYSDMLYRIALVQTGNREEAGDMVQQTFLKMLEHREKITDPCHMKAWLIRVCVNQCKNHRNTAWRRKVHLTDEEGTYRLGEEGGAGKSRKRYPGNEESPQEQYVIARQEQQALWQSIQRLPEKYRIVLHLAYQEEYTNGEIAQVLRISPGNVSVRLNRAKKMLAQQLEREGCRYERH